MDIRAKTSEALILRGRDYGEADRILVVFTRDRGKLSVIAKGVRRSKSHIKAVSQLFTHSQICISGGRGQSRLGVLSQGEMLDSLTALRADLDKISCAAYVGEMIDVSLPEGRPNEALFLLTLATLSFLAVSEEYHLILQWFNLRLLAILGYRPHLDSCLQCGRVREGAEFVLSPARGGIVCRECAVEGGLPLSGAAIAIMEKLLTWDMRSLLKLKIKPEHQKELERAVYVYLDYHLERSAKARTALQQYLPEL